MRNAQADFKSNKGKKTGEHQGKIAGRDVC